MKMHGKQMATVVLWFFIFLFIYLFIYLFFRPSKLRKEAVQRVKAFIK